jgi:hypothetical protein
MREAHISPILTQASWERLHGLAQLGLRDRFGGERPKDSSVVLSVLDGLAPDGLLTQTQALNPALDVALAH